MGITWRYEADANVIHSEASGRIELEDIIAYMRAVIADERVQRGFVELASFFEPELGFGYQELAPLPEMWQRYLAKGCRLLIFLAPTDSAYGMMRMLQGVLDQSDGDRIVVVRTREEQEAKLAELRR